MPPRVRTAVRRLRSRLGGNVHLYLFGSRATGGARSGSDWDVAVEGESSLDWKLLASAKQEASDLAWPYRIDIVDLKRAPTPIRESIRETCTPIEEG